MTKADKTITILHISDIHCGISDKKSPEYRRERKETIAAFYRDFHKIPSEWKPDIIAITGDIGWTGDSNEYIEFKEFLNGLLDKTNLTCEKVICCPGNHDKYVGEKFPKYHSLEGVWSNLDSLADNFKGFSQGLNTIGVKPLYNRSQIETTKYLYGCRTIEGIHFIVLNSAWLCDWREDKKVKGADRGKLLIDNNIVCELLENDPPQLPVICMYHHTNEWFRTTEISRVDGRPTAIDRVNNMAHIILNGHTHDPRENAFRQRLQYTAGTISSDDTYKSQCFLLKIHIDKDELKRSTVEEGKYYSNWADGKVSWFFEKISDPKFFDIEEEVLALQSELDKKDKRFQDLQKAMEEQEDKNKELEETYKKFGKHICDILQENRASHEKKENLQLEIQHIKAQIHKQNGDPQEMMALYTELVTCMQSMIEVQELDTKKSLSLFESFFQTTMSDTFTDVKKKEQVKLLIKTLSLDLPTSSETDNIKHTR